MGNEKIRVTYSAGITMLVFYLILGAWHWNRTVTNLTTSQLLVMITTAYIIGLAVSIVLFILKISRDFNLLSLSLLAFIVTLYLFVGDVTLEHVVIGFILISMLVATCVSFAVGIILYLLIR